MRLNFYTVDELERVVRARRGMLGISCRPPTARARSPGASRGTPRIAGRLLRRVRDFAHVAGEPTVDAEVADAALTKLEVDGLGLDAMDRRYLTMIADIYKGGPVGVETLAAGLAEPRDTVEDVIEPYPDPARPDRPHRARALPQRRAAGSIWESRPPTGSQAGCSIPGEAGK